MTFQQRLVELRAENRRTPCAGKSEWLSDNPSDRRQAAFACASCPLKTLCHTEAVTRRERFGVWGGHDLTARPARAVDCFDDKEKDEMRRLVTTGLGYRAIAAQLDLPRERVRAFVETLPAYRERGAATREQQDYEREAVEMRSIGLPYDSIARNLGITERQAQLAWHRHKQAVA